MIRPTALPPIETFLSGWLRDYVRAVDVTAFPTSYHVLNAYFGLSSIIGRRAYLRMDGFGLYPPMFIFLLGRSGVGKGQSMNLMREHILMPIKDNITGFKIMDPYQFTTAGIIRGFKEVQEEHNLAWVEGAVTVDEASAVFTNRVGTETMDEFIIKAHERKDIITWTAKDGEIKVKNFTAGLAFGSTVGKIRKSMDSEAFGGGLMHRFLIAHEVAEKVGGTSDPDTDVLHFLSGQALGLRLNAPQRLELTAGAWNILKEKQFKDKQKALVDEEMSGFWNRAYAITAQISMINCLSDGERTVGSNHVRQAMILLDALVDPLEDLVTELRYGPQQQKLFSIAESLYYSGMEGMSRQAFLKKIPASSGRKLHEALSFLRMQQLIFEGVKDGKEWLWAREDWKTT